MIRSQAVKANAGQIKPQKNFIEFAAVFDGVVPRAIALFIAESYAARSAGMKFERDIREDVDLSMLFAPVMVLASDGLRYF
jgi:hypothetical protein